MSREEFNKSHPLSSYAEGARKIREAKYKPQTRSNDADLVTPMGQQETTDKPKPMDKQSDPDLFRAKPSPGRVEADLLGIRSGLTDEEFQELKGIIERAKKGNNPADNRRFREIFKNARERLLIDDEGNPIKRKRKKKSSTKSDNQSSEKSNKEPEDYKNFYKLVQKIYVKF